MFKLQLFCDWYFIRAYKNNCFIRVNMHNSNDKKAKTLRLEIIREDYFSNRNDWKT